MKQKIYFLRGLPASGKSTWAKKKCAEDNNIVRINKDDLRAMMGGTFTKGKENLVLRARDNMIIASILEGKDVIIDDTNFHSKHLERINEISNGAEVEIIDFDTPVDECIKRDAKRDKPVGKAVIMDMYRKYVKQVPKEPLHDPKLPVALIVDIDGTLAHMDDRRSPHDYSKVIMDRYDGVVGSIVKNYRDSGGYEIIIVSGRKDDCRQETVRWLSHYGLLPAVVLMRKANDNRPDYIVKQEIYEEHIKGKYNIEFVLDDRDQVVRMWREQGLKCLQVAEGNF